MLYLTRIERRPDFEPEHVFPWSLPLVAGLEAIDFRVPVTLLVGENGSGKSTLLEGIAAGMGAVAAGSDDLERDPTLGAARAFAAAYRFQRREHPRTRLFVRAEDVFGFTKRVVDEIAGLRALEEEFRRDLVDGSDGQRRAMGMAAGQRRALTRRYGDEPDAQSHGQTFLRILSERLVPRGLYLLDEPETPLSPKRVLSLIALLKDRVEQDCQFIIATHSPILMAFPGAEILVCDDGGLRSTPYAEVEHVQITRDFLRHPEAFLRHL